MIAIASLPESAVEEIASWPAYPEPYKALDYALRGQGWLHTYGSKPDCVRLGGYYLGQLVGFSLLVPDAPGTAEFFIAIHPSHLHEGFGGQLTKRTLEFAFHRQKLSEVHLKVRINHEVGIHTYSKYGFSMSGKLSEMTNGVMTNFFTMSLSAAHFIEIENQCSST